ncbi:MAG: hypothetical protein WC091_09745 [Sulfuricellaceae bacterium]
MNKTKVDDMLLEMITPRLKEIEGRFSAGQGLTQDDINTLLLKSQYNHINHLDIRLDEVAASVVALEGKFQGLEGKFQVLESKFQTFAAEMRADFEKRMGALETRFEQAQVKMQETIISTMRWYIGGAGVVLVLIKALDVFVKH